MFWFINSIVTNIWTVHYVPYCWKFCHSAVCAQFSWSLFSSPPLVYTIIIQISVYVGCIGYAIYFVGLQSSVNCSSHVRRRVSEYRASQNFFLMCCDFVWNYILSCTAVLGWVSVAVSRCFLIFSFLPFAVRQVFTITRV